MPKRKRNYVDLMLDSGAFSAFKKGEQIDLKAYADYVKAHSDLWFSYVTLDVLPASQATHKSDVKNLRAAEENRSKEAIEAAAAQSQKNHYKLKDLGLTPIPVFHQGEDFKWLEQMLLDKEPYIGLSAIKSKWNEPSYQQAWLDKCWSMIEGTGVKVHGFGITGSNLLIKYPWYSVDSTTWSKGAGYGKIFVPRYTWRNGLPDKPDWQAPKLQISCSGVDRLADSSPRWRKSKRGHFEGFHFKGDLGPTAAMVHKFLNEEVGITLEQARYSSNLRRRAILVFYLRQCEALNIKLMFATAVSNKAWAELMNDVGATNRLLSYYELRNTPDKVVREFVQQGTCGKYVPQIPPQDYASDQYTNFRRIKVIERGLSAPTEAHSVWYWHGSDQAPKEFQHNTEELADEESGAPF